MSAKSEFGPPGSPGHPDAPWSAGEKEALAAWTVPHPPPDFASRVLAATAASPAPRSWPPVLSVLAAAAAVLVVALGLVSFRQWFALGEGEEPYPAAVVPFDAGPVPEVRPPFDGTGSQAS